MKAEKKIMEKMVMSGQLWTMETIMECFKNNKILNTMDEHNKCGRS